MTIPKAEVFGACIQCIICFIQVYVAFAIPVAYLLSILLLFYSEVKVKLSE